MSAGKQFQRSSKKQPVTIFQPSKRGYQPAGSHRNLTICSNNDESHNKIQYNTELPTSSLGKKCREAKENWLEEKCREVENLRLNAKEMFQKIKEITGKRSSPSSKCIKASNGSVLQEARDIANRWEEYIKDLFDDDQDPEEITFNRDDTGPIILKSEVRWTLNKMKNGKSSDSDGVYTEMIKALEEEGIDLLWKLISQVYETGVFPKEILKSIFVALPKIPAIEQSI